VSDTPAPMCVFCRHYNRQTEQLTCSAYPDGIPDVILRSVVDHREAYTGDHGIQFEPDPRRKTPPGYLEMLFP
jgi:hypothetical protein